MPFIKTNIIRFLFSSRNKKRDQLLTVYTDILNKQFSYFSGLSETERRVFIQRLHHFRKSKRFIHIGFEQNLDTEVLLSAAAIQISFGLHDYRFNFFKNIYIMKDAYTYGKSNVPWAGHVNRKGIHISWNHFRHGYAIANDRYNVGLHEMAHALEYEFNMGDFTYDEKLKILFDNVMNNVETVISHERLARSTVFTEEGIINKHECWAESIELFFENPAELNSYYPDLYNKIRLLLNQDTLLSAGSRNSQSNIE